MFQEDGENKSLNPAKILKFSYHALMLTIKLRLPILCALLIGILLVCYLGARANAVTSSLVNVKST